MRMEPGPETDARQGECTSGAIRERARPGSVLAGIAYSDSSVEDAHEADFPLQNILERRGDDERLYVHDCMESGFLTYERQLGPKADFLPERALLMAQPGDLVLVSRPVDGSYVDYLTTLELGPGSEGVVVVETSRGSKEAPLMNRLAPEGDCFRGIADRLRRGRQVRLNPFIATESAHRLRRRLAEATGREVILEGGSAYGTGLANRKDLVRTAARRLGVPIAGGSVVQLPEVPEDRVAVLRRAILEVLGAGSGALVRAAVSTSGADLLIIDGPADVADAGVWLERRPRVDVVLVEEFVPASSSPNVGLWVADDGVCTITGTTDQRLSPTLSHCGNAYPCQSGNPAMIDSARQLAEYLSDHGYRGPMGVDFIVPIESSRSEYMLAEVNGRINGATYPTAVHQRLNRIRRSRGEPSLAAWISSKAVSVPPCSFDVLRSSLDELMLVPGRSTGVLPYGTGWLQHGLCNFLIFAETVQLAEDLESRMIRRLQSRGRVASDDGSSAGQVDSETASNSSASVS